MPTRAEILLAISSDVTGVRKTQEAMLDVIRSARAMDAEMKMASKTLSGFGDNFVSTVKAGVGLGAGFTAGAAAANILIDSVKRIGSEIKSTLTEGVRFNATLEQSTLGVASVLKQFNPDKYRDFGSAMSASTVIIDQLKKKALETAATFEELLTAYQGTAGAMASAGIPLSRQVGLIVNISQAMGALGIQTAEMRQEATALLMGNIDRNARLAQTLGITADQIKTAKEQGNLYEFLTGKLKAFSEAGALAADNITVLESNLKDAKTQVAADETKELAGAYKELLQSLTVLVKSDAWREVLRGFASMASWAVSIGSDITKGFSQLGGGDAKTRDGVANAKNIFDSAQNSGDLAKAKEAAEKEIARLVWQNWKEVTGRTTEMPGKLVLDERDRAMDELRSIVQRASPGNAAGILKVRENQAAAEKAKMEALSLNLAKEAQTAREKGVKTYEKENEAAQARIRAAAKDANPAWYVDILNADKRDLMAQLNGPDAKPERYLGKGDASDPTKVKAANTAAEGFRLEIMAKIAAIEKEIDVTKDTQDKKAKTEADRREKAQVRYLGVKAQEGTLEDKITALNAEKNALDKTDLNYKADALAIDQKIAKLKGDEAARLNAELSKEAQRRQQAAVQAIQDNQFLTDREKRQQLYLAAKIEQLEIEKKIAVAEALVKSAPEGAEKVQARGELDTLKTRRDVGIPHEIALNRPLTMMEEISAGLVVMENGFATVATSIQSILGGTITGLSAGIKGLFTQTMSLGQAAWSAMSGLRDSVVQVFSDMAAQWIVKHTLMAAWSKLFAAEDLATHTATEVQKTTVTTVNAAGRTVVRTTETITTTTLKEGEGVNHVVVEGVKTKATLLGGMIRVGVAIKEALASMWAGAVAAYGAIAAIPVVGPFLAPLAVAAAVVMGMKLISNIGKGFKKGGYTGDGHKDEEAGTVHKGEVVFSQEDVARHGGPAAVDALRVKGPRKQPMESVDAFRVRSGGYTNTSRATTGAVTAKPVEAKGGGDETAMNQAFFNTQHDAEQWLRTKRGRKVMTDFMKQESAWL